MWFRSCLHFKARKSNFLPLLWLGGFSQCLKGDRNAGCGHTAPLFSRPALASSTRCTSAMENIDALLRSSVRVDTATNKRSVLDLLMIITGKDSSHASTTLKRDIIPKYPELGSKCAQMKINAK